MSKIYIIGGKSDFVNTRKHDYKSTVMFIKKYHNYYPHLLFLPTVLADMIFDYINDVFNIECDIHNLETTCIHQIKVNTNIVLNYETIPICFRITASQKYYNVYTERLQIAINKYPHEPFSHKNYINKFMFKYYKKQYDGNDKVCCYAIYKTNKNVDNIKHYKNEIIIIQKMIKLSQKLCRISAQSNDIWN